MNKITILAISTVFVASILAITVFEAEAKPPSQVACPAENVQHWIFVKVMLTGGIAHQTLQDFVTADEVSLQFQRSSNPGEIIQEIADYLSFIGYTNSSNPVSPSQLRRETPLRNSRSIYQ